MPKDELKHNQVTNHKIIMYHSKDSTKRPSSTSGQAPQSEEQMFRRDIADDTKSYTYEEWNTKFYAHLQPFLWKFCIIISVVLVLILVAVISASAQNKSAEDADFETIIGELFSLQDEDIDYSELYESLFQYYTQPINLNNTSPDVLRSLFVLSDRQIQNFFMHIQKNGRLLSIYELQAIPDFDLETINRLLPFVTVRETGTQADTRSIWKRILQEKNTFFLLRYSQTLEERKGYSIQEGDTTSSGDQKSRYLGTPFQTYLRFRTSHTKDFSIGFTLEKDQGEQFAWNSKNKQYGADFISAHAVLYNQGSFKALAVGDYKVQIGQGLILGGGFGLGKGSESINTIRRSTLGIRPYNSVVEGGFFRGAAATYAVGRFDITSFYSRLPQDANITSVGDTLSNEEDFINSIQITGLHRTPNEIQNRKQIKERALAEKGDWYALTYYFINFITGFVLISLGKSFWFALDKVKFYSLLTGMTFFPFLLWSWYNLENQFFIDLIKTVNMWAWVLTIFAFSAKYLNKKSKLIKYRTQAVYPYYILHFTATIFLGYLLMDNPMHYMLKFILMTIGTFAFVGISYEFVIRRFSLLRPLFGLKKQQAK